MQENKLLKIGSILFIVGGLLGGLVPIINSLSTMAAPIKSRLSTALRKPSTR